MTDFILDYDYLYRVTDTSKSLGKEAEKYSNHLAGEAMAIICLNMNNSCSGYIEAAHNSLNQKADLLRVKAASFYHFADQITSLTEIAYKVDCEIEQLFSDSQKSFLQHHVSLRIDGWKSAILNGLVDSRNRSGLLGLLSKLLMNNRIEKETSKKLIQKWYRDQAALYKTIFDNGQAGVLLSTMFGGNVMAMLLGSLGSVLKYSQYNREEIFSKGKSLFKNIIKALMVMVDFANSEKGIELRRNLEKVKCEQIINNLIGNTDGNKVSLDNVKTSEVPWEKLLYNDADEITDYEYLLLAYGLITVEDPELMEKVLNQCYSFTDVTSCNEGGGITTVVVKNNSNPKLEKLYVSLASMTAYLSAIVKSCSKEELKSIFSSGVYERATQYTLLCQTLINRNDALCVASQTSIFTDFKRATSDTTSGKLLEFGMNENNELVLQYCKFGGKVYTVQQPITITISNLTLGDIAQNATYREFKNYAVNQFNISDSIIKTMVTETANQLLSAYIGEMPGTGFMSAASGILLEGFTQYTNKIEYKSMEGVGDLGSMLDTFDLMYVSSNVNNKASNHSFSIYASPTTQERIDAFNTAMAEGGELAAYAGKIKGDILQNDLNLEFILTNPAETSNIIQRLYVECDYHSIPYVDKLIND